MTALRFFLPYVLCVAWVPCVLSATHWSYIPPQRPAVPKDAPHPVDAFIRAKLQAAGLQPAKPAAPAIWLRRVTLDLTGLPPTLAEVDAFTKAHSNDVVKAKADVVDRLLASSAFGVRWARPWLDLARYADSHGFQRDDFREVWAYRDWVVDALNADMPFDQFTREQIAGDLLPNPTPAQFTATGFHRCTPTNVEAGTEPEESRINQVIDRVNTTASVWLGSTLECAQCHDHKYDPLTQRDYYSLLSYFNNTPAEASRAKPTVPGSIKFDGVPYELPDPTRGSERRLLNVQLAALNKQIAALQPSTPGTLPAEKDRTVLRPTRFDTDSEAEPAAQPDGSTLLTGPVPGTDDYTIEFELPAMKLTGLMIEALAHDALPRKGPGRSEKGNPNFVLNAMDCTLDGQPLTFASATASHSQGGYDVSKLIDSSTEQGWAIMPRFSESHWAQFGLATARDLKPGSKLTLKLAQHYGGGRVIGCLRVSALTGPISAPIATEPAIDKAKRGKAKAEPTVKSSDPRLAKLQAQQKKLTAEIKALAPASTEVMRELPQPRMTAIFKRGDYTAPTDPVTAAVPAALGRTPSGPSNRLTLASWLTARDNPLTARVTVNRWWAELFGTGIVASVEDFGIKGTPPTHPELLDWLAVEFMESGWKMKALLKLIVTSETYAQDSSIPDSRFLIPDSEHRGAGFAEAVEESGIRNLESGISLLSRAPRFRLDAETIRDNALAISGLLSDKRGGPPIYPPQPEGLWTKVGGQAYPYEVSPGSEQHRRGLYVVLKRAQPYPSFMAFDASSRLACVVRRSRSNTPLQALTLLNDPVYVEAAKAFGQRIERETQGQPLDAQLHHAFRLAVAREPSAREIEVLRQLHQSERPETAWQAIATALLNLDETITKP